MFFVWLSGAKTNNEYGLPTLELATYNWPCKNMEIRDWSHIYPTIIIAICIYRINCHRKSHLNEELNPLKSEWKISCNNRNSWNKDFLSFEFDPWWSSLESQCSSVSWRTIAYRCKISDQSDSATCDYDRSHLQP
jgi:hypothetical protein